MIGGVRNYEFRCQDDFQIRLDRSRELDRFAEPSPKKIWDDEESPVKSDPETLVISRSSQLSLDLDLKSVRANEAVV